MTQVSPQEGRSRGGGRERIALIRPAAAAAAMSVTAAAGAAVLHGGVLMALFAALVALAGMAIGHRHELWDGGATKTAHKLLLRVADELAQYRAFTQLLRDQGARIVESTDGAATMIIEGLAEMEANVDRMRLLADRAASGDAEELRALVEAVGAPVLSILGHLQFQDITQQQIVFLSRLSLLLDDHMVQLARELGDRRATDRVVRFKEMFDQALGDCVMDSQRNDHHAASGLIMREEAGSSLELF